MPARVLDIDGSRWSVYPSGYVTQYDADEFGIVFVRGTGASREVRVTRYAPRGARSREASIAAMSADDLRTLFSTSQPSANSPEAGYAP